MSEKSEKSLEAIIVTDLPEAQERDLSAFPEGGRQAWLTVLGASLIQFCTFGYMNAFGVYQGTQCTSSDTEVDFYVREYLTNYTPSAIGWIGGVQIFLAFGCGILTGRAFDRGYFHHLMIGGSLLHSFSFFMLSLSHEYKYYQVFLSHGLGGGLGTGIVYIPSLTVVSHYFQRNRPVAMGIVTVGTALGAVLHPILLNHLFHGPVGFHNGVRISAALNTVLLCIGNAIMRTRLPPKKLTGVGIPIVSFMRDPAYVFVVVGGVFVICGLFFPAFFLQLAAVKHGVDRQFAFYYLSILNAASVPGRVVPSIAAQKYGVFNVIIFLTVAMGVLICCLGVVKTTGGFVAFAVFFGFFFGGGTSLTPPMIGSLAKDMSEMGARIGTSLAISGIIGLFATPIAGALLTSNFHWWRPIIFNGTTMIVGAALFMVSRHLVAKRKGTQLV